MGSILNLVKGLLRAVARWADRTRHAPWAVGLLALLLPWLLVVLINPADPAKRAEFMAALLVYIVPAAWAIILARRAAATLSHEAHLLRGIEAQGQQLQLAMDNGTRTLTLDSHTWEQFVQGVEATRGGMHTSVRMVQSLCHEAVSGRFPPIATLTQIYALEMREGVRRLRVPQTLALRLGILGTFIGLLLALSRLGDLLQLASQHPPDAGELSPLVQSMMIAFGTSVAGLLSAILIQILGEVLLLRQQGLTRQIEDTVGRVATVLAMTFTGSTFMRDLDAFGDQLTRHRSGLSDHAHQVRVSSRDAVDAVERHAGILGESATSLVRAQEHFTSSLHGLQATLGKLHGSLDALGGLDGRLSQLLQTTASDREQAFQRASQAGLSAVASALLPMQESLTTHVDQAKVTSEKLASSVGGLEAAMSTFAKAQVHWETYDASILNLTSAVHALMQQQAQAPVSQSRGQRLLTGLMIAMVASNTVLIGWLVSHLP